MVRELLPTTQTCLGNLRNPSRAQGYHFIIKQKAWGKKKLAMPLKMMTVCV